LRVGGGGGGGGRVDGRSSTSKSETAAQHMSYSARRPRQRAAPASAT